MTLFTARDRRRRYAGQYRITAVSAIAVPLRASRLRNARARPGYGWQLAGRLYLALARIHLLRQRYASRGEFLPYPTGSPFSEFIPRSISEL